MAPPEDTSAGARDSNLFCVLRFLPGRFMDALAQEAVKGLHLGLMAERFQMFADHVLVIADSRTGLSLLRRQFMDLARGFINQRLQ